MRRLRDLREDKDMSQTDLAKAIGVDQTAISRWEIGKSDIPISFLPKICALFSITIEEFLGLPICEKEKIIFKEPELTFDWYVRQLPRFTNYQISQIIGAGNYIMTRRSDTIKNDEIPETPAQGPTQVKPAIPMGRGEPKKTEEKS